MQPWPADKIERRPITSLIPYARNARTHSEGQVAEIAESMKEWGWTSPILIDEGGVVIAGHGRLLAARKLGFDSIPVMVADGWTEAQKKAYTLADNQLAINAGWNEDFLKLELQELNGWGFDLSLVGFDNLDGLMGNGTEGLFDSGNRFDQAERNLVLVEVSTEQEQQSLFNEMTERGHIVKVMS
jgi:hypothetical protein